MTHAVVLALLLGETLRPGVAVKDEGTLKGRAQTVNCTGAGVTCSVAGGVWTLNGSGGAGGSPGGSGAEVQYRSGASTFGAVAKVTSDGTNLILAPVTTVPSAPASGLLPFAHSPITTSAPAFQVFMDAASGVGYSALPFAATGHGSWGCMTPGGGGTSLTTTGGGGATLAQSAVAGSWAVTNAFTRFPIIKAVTSASANSTAIIRTTWDVVWRGNAAGLGGFFAYYTFGNASGNAATGNRWMAGLWDVVGAPFSTGDPDAALDTVYFGCNAAGSTMNICSNDNVSTATCVDLGANYPCNSASQWAYNAYLWAAPNGSSIGYAIERIDSAFSTSGTIISDLPRNTLALVSGVVVNTGANTGAQGVLFAGSCYWAGL